MVRTCVFGGRGVKGRGGGLSRWGGAARQKEVPKAAVVWYICINLSTLWFVTLMAVMVEAERAVACVERRAAALAAEDPRVIMAPWRGSVAVGLGHGMRSEGFECGWCIYNERFGGRLGGVGRGGGRCVAFVRCHVYITPPPPTARTGRVSHPVAKQSVETTNRRNRRQNQGKDWASISTCEAGPRLFSPEPAPCSIRDAAPALGSIDVAGRYLRRVVVLEHTHTIWIPFCWPRHLQSIWPTLIRTRLAPSDPQTYTRPEVRRA